VADRDILRVAVVSKSDALGGGASRVADDLTTGLNRSGHVADHFSAFTSTRFAGRKRSLYGDRIARSLVTAAHYVGTKSGFPQAVPFELLSARRNIPGRYDIVHFHDLAAAISPLTLRGLAQCMPAVWTFHDCSPFTGGCLYPLGCERFRTRCGCDGGCPQLGAWPLETRFDHTGALQALKIALHRSGTVTNVAPSTWMADLAVSTGYLLERPQVISNGVDADVFAPPADVGQLRSELELPRDRPIVLISAGPLNDERKGIRRSIEAVRAIADLNPFALVVGMPDQRITEALGTIEHRAVGYVSDQRALARWYGAADVFLFCSLADNQPLSVLETMACGTPVVAFATGGIPDLVESGRTGRLVPPSDTSALVQALRGALAPGVARVWGEAARARAVRDYSRACFIERHIALYRARIMSRAAS
jgi:glycosyltransferase involved in cell wall biosynthesis